MPPTRSIMDHPEDFTAIVTTLQWVRRMATMARLHTIIGSLVLALHMVRLFGALRFHPHTAILVDTLIRCASRLQPFIIMYALLLLVMMAVGMALFGHGIAAFSTVGGALSATWMVSIGELQPLCDEVALLEPVLGPLYSAALIFLTTFVMFNVLISLIMEVFAQVQAAGSSAEVPSVLSCLFTVIAVRSGQLRAAVAVVDEIKHRGAMKRAELQYRLEKAGSGRILRHMLLHGHEAALQKQQAALKTQHATEALQQLNGQLNGKVNHAVKSFLEKVAPRSEDDVARAARERLQRARERVANLGAVRRRYRAPDRPAEAGM